MLSFPEFLVRNLNAVQNSKHDTIGAATEEAQSTANRDGAAIGLFELIKTYKPKPKVVAKDIDELIENRAREFRKTSTINTAIACGVLRELKKSGVTHLDLPDGVEL